MSNPSSLAWLSEELERLERQGLSRPRRIGMGVAASRVGRPTAASAIVDFGSNDYLGLAGDPRLAAAAAEASERCGFGAGASPVVSGRSAEHVRLEQAIARFEGVDAVLLFPSGFAANAGTIPALVGEGDVIYSDAKNHASLIDGCRLTRACRCVYPHADTAALARLLSHDAGRFRRRLIATDTLFSMDGDFSPLAELGELAERHNAMLLVDEAHATGVWGPSGKGAVEQAAVDARRLPQQIAARVGTLSKALGSAGGFVAGSQQLIDWLANRARPYVFSTATPPGLAAAAAEALRIAECEPDRRERVIANATWLNQQLTERGWSTGSSASQILPIFVGPPAAAVRLSARLAEQGLFAPAIRPPSVPEGESLIRVSVAAKHDRSDLQRLLDALGAPCDRS